VDTTTAHRSSAEPDSTRIRVSHAMHRGVLTCPRDTSLDEVARLMSTHRVHCVVVTGDEANDHDLWGIVSDLDLAAAASVRGLADQTAGATAATPLLTIRPDETVQRAAQLMTEHAITHLVVVDAGHRPVGVISTLDLAASLSAPESP
jgi:CBS domain-containing protein